MTGVQTCALPISELLKCNDSDSSNFKVDNFYEKGETSIFRGEVLLEKEFDECNGTSVIEKYCYGDMNIISEYSHECPNGCLDGACITKIYNCTDSDGGIDYKIKGNVTFNDNISSWSHSDWCRNNEYLSETSCDKYMETKGKSDEETYLCPNGCLDGACI